MRSVLRLALLLTAACSDARAPNTGTPTSTVETEGPRPGMQFAEVPLNRFCESKARADCHRMEICAPMRLGSAHGTRVACEADRAQMCEGWFTETFAQALIDDGALDFDAAAMGRALTAYSQRHCNARGGVPTTFSGALGRIVQGQPCADHALCVSGWCEGYPANRCGTCGPHPGTAPSSCPESCPGEQVCECTSSDAGSQCGCVASLPAYADCGQARSRCVEGTRCLDGVDAVGNRKTACVPVPALGSPCGASIGISECHGEAYCEEGRCRAPIVVAAGAACDTATRLCPVGHDCRGVCVPMAGPGQRCVSRRQTTIPDGGPPTCSEGVCQGDCQAPQGANAFCLEGADCMAGLGCNLFGGGGGQCQDETTVRARVTQLFTCP